MHTSATLPTLFPYTTLFRSAAEMSPQWKVERIHDRHSPVESARGRCHLGTENAAADHDDIRRRKQARAQLLRVVEDRKSTRLNSSHLGISYAVFCLKKKKRE